jgi:hypothetical protein
MSSSGLSLLLVPRHYSPTAFGHAGRRGEQDALGCIGNGWYSYVRTVTTPLPAGLNFPVDCVIIPWWSCLSLLLALRHYLQRAFGHAGTSG